MSVQAVGQGQGLPDASVPQHQLTEEEAALVRRAVTDPDGISGWERGKLRAIKRWAAPADAQAIDRVLQR